MVMKKKETMESMHLIMSIYEITSYDAIVLGAAKVKQALPTNFHLEMDIFLSNCKKECVQEKQKGNLDEQEADLIPFSLYEQICHWSTMSSGLLFLWVFFRNEQGGQIFVLHDCFICWTQSFFPQKNCETS